LQEPVLSRTHCAPPEPHCVLFVQGSMQIVPYEPASPVRLTAQ
jgi:hypothetical protein